MALLKAVGGLLCRGLTGSWGRASASVSRLSARGIKFLPILFVQVIYAYFIDVVAYVKYKLFHVVWLAAIE